MTYMRISEIWNSIYHLFQGESESMYTLERVNKIREHYCLQPLSTATFFGCGHSCMDFIDQRAGLITRHMFQEIDSRHVSHFVPAPLGNRVRRHERHIERQKAPALFWLGAEGEAA